MKILIVEDDKALNNGIAMTLGDFSMFFYSFSIGSPFVRNNIYYTRFQDEMEKKEGMAYTLVMEVVYEKNRNSSSKSRKS